MEAVVSAPLKADEVRQVFEDPENNREASFKYVADDVDWIVEGHHPLAGHYHSKKEFLSATFEKLIKVLPGGAELKLVNLTTSGDWAIA